MELHVCISLIEHLSYASPHVCFNRAQTYLIFIDFMNTLFYEGEEDKINNFMNLSEDMQKLNLI